MVAQSQPITFDALYFTLKLQSGILLDSAKARSFDSNLTLAKRKLGIEQSTNANTTSKDFFTTVEVEFSSTNTVLVNSWQQGKVNTGNKKLDSLSSALGLITVNPLRTKQSYNLIIYVVSLRFRSPINDIRAEEAFMDDAFEINSLKGSLQTCCRTFGSSGWLDYFECQNGHYFIFYRGSGDCLAGCLHSRYYYAAVQQSGTEKLVTAENSYGWGYNFTPPFDRPYPYTVPYNYPNDIGYSVTQFGSADVLIQSLRHPTWWVQNHAIQGVWRVLTSDTPISLDGYWTDSARKAQWSFIRRGVLSRRTEIVSTLQSLRGTGICGVSVSIDTALKRILTVGVSEEALVQTPESIITAPNPFGEMLQISYNVSQYSHIKVSIVNTLGATVATLFNGYQTEGQLSLEWQPENMPSGIYSVQIWKNSHPLSSKRIALIR